MSVRRVLGSWSLRARMAGLFTLLLVAIGVFMLAFFPSRMADQARTYAEHRAVAIAQVMSTALGPAIEFDDDDNAAAILAWLATTPDARFGVVRRLDQSALAVWHAEALPRGQVWPQRRHLEARGELLVVTVPVVGLGGGAGYVHVGFSLHALADERAHTIRAVGEATVAVCLVGLLAIWMLASWLVRPIRRLTVTAQRISRGELPPQLPVQRGSDEVAQMAEALRVMLAQLNEANQQLLVASRYAGMAEIATGVLHNVGNVLNSVNVSVDLMHERTRELPIDRLQRLEALLATVAGGAPDPARLAALVRYVEVLREAFQSSRETSLDELGALRGHLDHVKQVVAMQNAYARRGGLVEAIAVDQLLRDAVELGGLGDRAAVTLEAPATVILLDRHRVLQILVNLLTNARDAIAAAPHARLAGTATLAGCELRIEVMDSGVGIPADALARLFTAGFTTKPRGHGYGLHSAANAARQLGGALTAASPGVGQGATFTLVVPVQIAPVQSIDVSVASAR